MASSSSSSSSSSSASFEKVCCHFNSSLYTNAIHILRLYHGKNKNDNTITTACLHCGFVGNLNSFQFQNHLLEHQHFYCIRIKEPFELYCSYCGDYQYNEQLDKSIGKKRQFVQVEKKKEQPTIVNDSVVAKPINANVSITTKKFKTRGICNMGATCFMNSVLQILLHVDLVRSTLYSSTSNKCRKRMNHGRFNTTSEESTDEDNDDDDDEEEKDIPPVSSHVSNGCIACEMGKLFKDATIYGKDCTLPSIPSLVPAYLLYSVWCHVDHMAGYEQQDAHEFLVALLDGLETHLHAYHTPSLTSMRGRGIVAISPHPHKKSAEYSANDLVKKLFSGVLQSELVCTHCGKRSPKYERYLDLSLTLAPHHFFGETGTPRVFTDGSVASVLSPDGVVPPGTPSVVTPSVSTRRHSRMTDLRDCLLEFTSRETLNQMLTCERCHEPRKTSKQLSLTSTPPVLVIQLKRFDAISQKKLSTPVKFPIRDLDMTPFMSKNVYDDKVGFVDPPSARFTPRTSSTTASHNHVRISTIDEEIPRGNSSGSGAHGDIFVASSSSSGSQNPETEVLSTDPSKNLSQTSSNSNNSSSGGSAVPRLSLIVPSIETNPPSTQSALHNDSVVYDLCGLVSHIGSLNQGHYVSFVLADNGVNKGQWLRCDDEKITVVREEVVRDTEAYLLFYRQKSLK